MQQLVEWGSVSREAVDYLKKLVKAGYNIFPRAAGSTPAKC